MAGFLVPDGAKRMLPVSSLLGQQPTQVRDVSPDFWFSPLQPVQPTAPSSYRPRQFAYNPGANLIWQPKADEGYGFDLLRVLADSWDLLRIALEMKKDEIQDVEFDIRLRRVEGESGADYKKRAQGNKQLQDVIQFWRKPDGRHTWKQWLRMLSEDMLVIDAMACYIARDSTKKIAAFMPTDGATWNRLLTDQGVTPGDDGGAAFQQILYGLPAFDATQDDIVYSMQNERTFRRYGFGRVERILLTVAFGLRRQHWQISEYCYSADTEVLTRRGWLKFSETTFYDEFATRRLQSGEFEWQHPTAYTQKKYQGDMLHFYNRSVDLLVTPNHRMIIAGIPNRNEDNWTERVITAGDLAVQSAINPNLKRVSWFPQTSVWHGVNIESMDFPSPDDKRHTPIKMSGDQFCAFMGMYLAEGCTNAAKPGMVTICQPKGDSDIWAIYKAKIDEIFGQDVYHDGKAFTVGRKDLAKYLKQFGDASHKFIPEVILNATADQLEIFWYYYVLGDGEASRALGETTRSQQCFTVSPRLRDGLTEVIQKLGMAPTVNIRPAGTSTVGKRQIKRSEGYNITARVTHGGTKQWDVEPIDYDGEVFCVSVPNGILYTRRNGKYAWCGNTSGNIPEAFLFMPPDIAPERLSDLQNWLDATLSGNLDQRRKMRIMPGFGTDGKPNIVFPKEALLKDELDEWLAKLVCATVGVSSSPFMKQMNRASAEEGNDASREKYLKPDVDHICDFVNTCLEKMGLADYEMVAKEQRETDPLKQAQADDLRIGKVKTVNEIREDAGEDPIDSPNANRLGMFTPTGFVPLDPTDDDVAQMQALKGPAPIPGGPAGADGKTPPKLGAPKGKPPGKGGSAGVKPRATPAGSTAAEGKKPAGRKLLGESELEKAAHSYGIVMIEIDPQSEVGLRMEAIREAIPDEHLMEGNGTKREENPHVTVRYGIVGDVGTIPEYLATIIPFSMRFGPTMAFDPTSFSDGAAPLVIRIDCPELEQINAMLPEYAEFKKSDFVYHPHATLAYVKPEFVAQYVGDTYCEGIEYPVEHIDVRDVDDNVDVVMLAGDFYQTEKAAKPLTGGNWVTINGAHVYIDEKGIVIHGPRHLMGTKPEQRTPVSSSAERHPGRHARTDADRIERAKKSHVLADAHIQKLADENEASLSKHLGVQRTRDNSPFDLQDGSKVGIELKLVAVQKNDKITMSKSAMALKRDAIKAQKIKSVFTIVTDARSARKSYLVRDGVGSFRLSSMKQVTLSELKDIIARRKI